MLLNFKNQEAVHVWAKYIYPAHQKANMCLFDTNDATVCNYNILATKVSERYDTSSASIVKEEGYILTIIETGLKLGFVTENQRELIFVEIL